MASDVDIASAALNLLGDAGITSFTEDNDRARLANRFFNRTRDELLRAHPWNFALFRERLAQNTVSPDFGYENSFALPNDPFALRVLSLGDPKFDPPMKFNIEGRDLLTDESEADCIMIARIEDPNLFNDLFTSALEYKLAMKMAYPITGSMQVSRDFFGLYKDILREARSIDAQEGTMDEVIDQSLIEIR